MDIRFISSLSPADEGRLASALIDVVVKLLEPFPIVYTIRIETGANQVFEHRRGPDEAAGDPGPVVGIEPRGATGSTNDPIKLL